MHGGGVCVCRMICITFWISYERVQAALPPPPPTQQHLVTTEQAVLTVTMTPPRVDTNPPVHDNTPIRWQQGHTNHHNTTEQQTNRHGMGQAPKRTHRDYIFGKVIGEGSFSTVYLAKDIHNGKECAIKVCEKRHILRERKGQYIRREKEVLNLLSLNHKPSVPFFVKLQCTFQDVERLYFVLTYAKNSELLPYITKVGSFDITCSKFYAAELLVALEHLHSLGIIHRDLKPENILLDENMHILITDFGSSKILNEPTNEGEDDGKHLRRRNSFVGTAQYVSPELLTEKSASRSSDLWALGCIIYQMVSGLPPFRSRSEYIIFQKILKLEYEFPDGFAPVARSIVEKLLVLDPSKRLGSSDSVGYPSLRSHPFFAGIDFKTLHEQTPPQIYPYLPGTSEHEELRSHYRVPDHLEPGLDDKQLTRLLGLDLQGAERTPDPPERPRKRAGLTDLSPDEVHLQLEKQKDNSKWHNLVEGNLILKQGLVDKRKGLFARRRMLLLTLGPHLYYVDPVNMILKGEIPWSPELRVEPKNFKIFFVHTPNRTYYLEDPEGYALEWCKAIEEVRIHTYGLPS
ncbi:3-phosphoinositide-dependent protein kinase 1 isoform X3 [Zootermopsis nevadensis]|uniref:3-phosphoinositide-dependent protein kinase 1 isoform X3 n=1 Tax=Zootermopsis nevadensis TaxID=136037 RepID=UPI000B8EE76F|nr:3-phosphoinositide-dependent protein kinase 1 isoform X3 [Zootermopsis nevadensis]